MIPKILWQTAKSVDYLNDYQNAQNLKSWVRHNPELDIMFMDDNACDVFIWQNFSKQTYNMYCSLPLGVMRADFWRVAVVYINGGIYSDVDVFCRKNIDDLLKNESIVLLQEINTDSNVSNFFFAAEPKHPFLKEVIDVMCDRYKIAFDVNSDMLVQNFGMDPLQQIFNKTDYKLLPINTHTEYISHLCAGSWRESEQNYINKRDLKEMIFFTTFNQSGYELYGKSWIRTFKENVASKYPNAKAWIYTHGFELEDNHPQIEILDYDEMIPNHNKWKEEFQEKSTYAEYVHKMTIRFSHKAMVIQDALKKIKEGYAFWVDGDVVFHETEYESFPKDVLSDRAMACQVEHAGNNHVESGILIFDMSNPDVQKWRDHFEKNYIVDELLTMGEPYDGFVVFKSLITSGIKFVDLNETYGAGGIQSCPTLTFLHPELSKRFTHNIGLTGKSQYKDWDDIKHTDEIFRNLAAVGVLSPIQQKIRNLKAKKKLIIR